MFQQGDLSWAFSRSMLVAAGVVVAAAVVALVTYRGLAAADELRDRIVLVGLRLAALAVLLVCLFRPTLILKAAVPQQNFLGVLVDDSRSMAIADRDGKPRSEFIERELAVPNAALMNALSRKFVVRMFSFSSASERVGSAARFEVRRNGHAPRASPGPRARRAVRAPARGPRDGDRRRRHVRRRDRRNAREPQGADDSGLHRGSRAGAIRERHPGHARRNAAGGPQRHGARRRRRRLAGGIRGTQPCRSPSRTMDGS